MVALEPAPGSEHTKQRQFEYDALGNLASVCEITPASDGGNCGQNTSATGYWTKYSYGVNGLLSVSQNAQAQHPPSRSFITDELGRMISETNPETGTVQYFYDSDPGSVGAACPGTYNGDLVKKYDAQGNTTCYAYDAQGNTTCYAYDALHRVRRITYSGPYSSVTPSKYFVYDAASLNSTAMANAKGRLAEAYTGSSSSKTTDLFFSYSARGAVTDVYEKTPNSSGYYRVTASYLANGGLSTTQNLVGLPTITYGADGEGRISTVSASSGKNPVVAPGLSYNIAGQVTGIPLGSGDSDSFQFDNARRLNKYTFNVGTKSVIGQVNWNPNGTLGSLAITDPSA
jgi:hypothetical protein